MAERSEAKNAKSEASRQKKFVFNFYVKLRFALLASLRPAILNEIKADYNLVILPLGVNSAGKEANTLVFQ
jgi:hypothetical protein